MQERCIVIKARDCLGTNTTLAGSLPELEKENASVWLCSYKTEPLYDQKNILELQPSGIYCSDVHCVSSPIAIYLMSGEQPVNEMS